MQNEQVQAKGKGGRPGTTRTDEVQLLVRETLEKDSYLSNALRYNRKRKATEQVHMLTVSKRRCCRDHPGIHEHMRERTCNKHLKKSCGDFQVEKKQGDVCDIWLHYDNRVLPRCKPLVDEERTSIATVCPDYLAAFDKRWLQVVERPDNHANPEYILALQEYVLKHCDRRVGFKISCPPRTPVGI